MSRTEALVLAGHGSQHHPDAAAPLFAHADRLRESGRFEEVRAAFWREEPSLSGVCGTLAADVAFVVPVLTSEGYFADEVFPRELGAALGDSVEDPTPPTGPEVRCAEPVGTHDAVTDVVADRVESAIEGPPDDVGVALVGHGTERHGRSARATVEHARRLESLGRYADVAALFLDEAPHVGELYDRLDAAELVVVPYFVADGHHVTRDLPAAIHHPGVGESATVRGRRVHCTRAVGTEPRLAEAIVERAVEAGARADAGPSGLAPPDRGFRRWVDASESPRTWGELAASRQAGGYELRHRADVERGPDALDELAGPAALRKRVRADDRGRYRPLAGARSLPTGWVLRGLEPEDLAQAVRFVYPGSVADRWRDRTGTLDVTPFAETAARATGDYADLERVEAATLGAAVEAVCGDCVREPRWGAGDVGSTAEPTDGTAAAGRIPCREACPFLRSAVAEFHDADAPDPSNEADPTVPAAAFDEPGNRYRVRFARALARRLDDGSRRRSNAVAAPGGRGLMRPGTVAIVGAGPGDPELLTVKARRRLDAADVVLHDSLVGGGVLESLPASARRVNVGKRPGGQRTPQAEINRRMVEEAERGKRVVRLKGGDPTVFGRGGEEAEHLAAAGVPFEVVPGVSSVLAGPQAAGIPLTHREHASSLTVVTGHEDPTKPDSALDWEALARTVAAGGTLVILMGVSRLPDNVRALREHGVATDTPVAMVERATLPGEFAVTDDLSGIVATARDAGIEPPAVTVVGDVVAVGERVAAVEGAAPALVGSLAGAALETDGGRETNRRRDGP